MSESLGDNTQAPPDVLARQVILCAGEDQEELLRALALHPVNVQSTHAYRCYHFWRCTSRFESRRSFVLIWTGIGTGCIEPLLREILFDGSPVEQIVLVGTAGQLRDFNSQSLTVTPVLMSPAYVGPSALSALGERGPLTPTLAVEARLGTVFSTDLYYLWNQRTIPEWDESYTSTFAEAWRKAQYVDMEVAQFYWLCRRFGGELVRYAAIKGAANELGVAGQQSANSLAVLNACIALTLRVFGFPHTETEE